MASPGAVAACGKVARVTCFTDLPSHSRQELWAVLALRHAQGIGALRAKRLVQCYGSALAAAEAALARPQAWSERGLVPLPTARRFASGAWREAAGLEWAAIRHSGLELFFWGDAHYPERLAEIDDAPLLLYYRGDISLLHSPAVAVVGARNCTREGIATSAFFSRALSGAGVTVVSGLARGIDRAAHMAGLEGPGRTVAVLGTGIDVVYPACNADIYALVGREGLLLSEFVPGTGPVAAHFPVRNRLISGLSAGVLVVEAAGRSGSLITARLALEQNREVFAVPGPALGAAFSGCHELIRRGAKPVFQADDILMELAPLLTLEAQRALEKRRIEAAAPGPSPARRPADEPHKADLDRAEAVLPEGPLPWAAPDRATPGAGRQAKTRPLLPGLAPVRPGTGGPRPPRAGAEKGAKGSKNAPGPKGVQGPGGGPGSKNAPEPGGTPGTSGTSGTPGTEVARQLHAGPETGALPESSIRKTALDETELAVLAALKPEPVHIDALGRELGLDAARLSGLLTLLEMRGLVRRAPGMYYTLPEA